LDGFYYRRHAAMMFQGNNLLLNPDATRFQSLNLWQDM
jgi:hypothetical protein